MDRWKVDTTTGTKDQPRNAYWLSTAFWCGSRQLHGNDDILSSPDRALVASSLFHSYLLSQFDSNWSVDCAWNKPLRCFGFWRRESSTFPFLNRSFMFIILTLCVAFVKWKWQWRLTLKMKMQKKIWHHVVWHQKDSWRVTRILFLSSIWLSSSTMNRVTLHHIHAHQYFSSKTISTVPNRCPNFFELTSPKSVLWLIKIKRQLTWNGRIKNPDCQKLFLLLWTRHWWFNSWMVRCNSVWTWTPCLGAQPAHGNANFLSWWAQ